MAGSLHDAQSRTADPAGEQGLVLRREEEVVTAGDHQRGRGNATEIVEQVMGEQHADAGSHHLARILGVPRRSRPLGACDGRRQGRGGRGGEEVSAVHQAFSRAM